MMPLWVNYLQSSEFVQKIETVDTLELLKQVFETVIADMAYVEWVDRDLAEENTEPSKEDSAA